MISRRVVLVNSKRFASSQAFHYTPDLKNLELRWAKMKELDQADVLDYLQSQSKKSWRELSKDEKKALYYIYYGEWGPRSTTKSTPISQILLNGWFYGFLLGALGVGYYNWQIDQKHEKKYLELQQQVEKLEELKQLQQTETGKSWWRLWG